MKRLHKFLSLPTVEKTLLLEAVLLVILVKLSLIILPFKMIQGLINYIGQALSMSKSKSKSCNNTISPEQISWAVAVASRYLLSTKNCLPQALAGHILLTQYGHPAKVSFGIYRGNEIKFEAHAWIESKGKIVIGKDGIENYTPLFTNLKERA